MNYNTYVLIFYSSAKPVTVGAVLGCPMHQQFVCRVVCECGVREIERYLSIKQSSLNVWMNICTLKYMYECNATTIVE